MIMNSKDKDMQAKQEGDTPIDNKITNKVPSTSRQWTGFKNPRIVRVSRAFGGKDRHSKVCTIRGLRDRRIRLSVPTAIQLYDLQDRLGLSQPSKVVDWLIDATKHEIDKLPPLQIPPGSFTQFHQPSVFSQESIAPPQASSSLSQFFNGGTQTLLSSRESIDINHHGYGNWSSDAAMREKSKEGEREAASMEKDASNEQENLENYGGYVAQLSAQNLFPLANQASFPGLLNNGFPYNTYFHWEPSNLSLSRFGNNSFTFQTEDNIHSQNSNHSLAFPSSATLPSGSQLYFCPSVIPPYMNASVENEQRQINHLQLLSSTAQNVMPSNSLMPTLHFMSSPMKSFTENESSKLPPSQENDENQINKEGNQ